MTAYMSEEFKHERVVEVFKFVPIAIDPDNPVHVFKVVKLAYSAIDPDISARELESAERVCIAPNWEIASTEGQPHPLIDPLAAARLRGEQAKRDIVASHGHLLIGRRSRRAATWVTVPEVETRRAQRLLLALPLNGTTFGFPSWQFTQDGVLPGTRRGATQYGSA